MRIFFDVDTQHDFMRRDGALYVPGAEEIHPNLAKLTRYARANKVPVLGSVDRHFGTQEYKNREGELQRWGGPFPDHCMNGTVGQRKTYWTVVRWELNTRDDDEFSFFIENPLKTGTSNNVLECALRIIKETINGEAPPTGIYLEKQTYDIFTNPYTEELLKIRGIGEAVIYGVATDYCVKAAVLGMQKRGIQCYVVEDAIKGVAPATTKSALEEMLGAGAKFVRTEDVLEGRI